MVTDTFTFDTGIFGFFYKILRPVEWLVTYVMVWCHKFLTFIGLPSGPGIAWAISVVMLVILVRLCILPLFIKQMRSMRRLQALQPQLKKIQNKYKGKKDQASREAASRETMKLYQDNHANPAGSCLPMLIQSPVFMTMFYVLSAVPFIARGKREPLGAFTKDVAMEFEQTRIFGVNISDNLTTTEGPGRFVIIVFIALMCLTMFYSQFHNTRKNTPRASMEGTQYRMQKMMAYIFPVMYIFSGIAFPFAVLIYWLTNNTWNLGQTMWQVRNMPTPGSPAAEEKAVRDHDRENERRSKSGQMSLEEEALVKAKEAQAEQSQLGTHQRYQPSKKKGNKKKK
ncbi:membrane protein insertase YidC [Bifidobacterium crudilactis]|jgi:YidC/Oxa1 family membrane protein insertase|uniref:Membrane protein insertase YidC n=1 Tax=Bifidobacterium crudilactis TaxID=327277 RepID=A0A971CZP7_9BIFI|nr:membrane protein insertase YidC [Bifidobacterium crudilactis]MCI1218590.1 membrane protein insertase YidC [Bifidobacterium crudilactis]MCI1868672.1 membrane protein insertase YidC [Bifidobacterium crudilactis]MCI1889910.1 membrane protein insertase YidC [Bifidobacterium crudilactis]MDN6234128.1 membrane protein insertase YidC [Bifidobacterium crudilactis]NLT80028.1 membrane protein insertase YidC [Bifidobacterium crudilactis]